MTYINGINGIVSATNSNSSLSSVAWNMHTGIIVSSAEITPATGTFILDSGASGLDDAYNNLVIQIVSGLGYDRSYLITDYVGGTKTATIYGEIEILPDATSTFIIHTHSGKCGSQTQAQQFKTITLSDIESSEDNFYDNCFIYLSNEHIAHPGQVRRITNYDGTNKIISIDTTLIEHVTSNTLYYIVGESGTAQSGTSTTLTLESSHGHDTTDDHYNGLFIEIYSGTGGGQTREITNYVGSTLVCSVAPWTTAPDATSVYTIYSGWGASEFENSINYTQSTVALVSGSDQHTVIYQQLGLTATNSANRGKYALNSSTTPSSVHTLVNVSNYFKIKLVSMGTSLTGNFQTTFHTAKNKALTSFIEEQINQNNDCELTRSILCGKTDGGRYSNASVSNRGHLKTEISNPLTAFGELTVSQLLPVVQLYFPYYKNNDLITEFVDAGTVVTMNVEGDGSTAQNQSIYLPSADQFTSSGAGNYFYIFDGGATQYYIWYDINGGNSDPSVTGTGVQVSIASTSETSSTVATNTKTALDAIGGTPFTASVFGSIVTITNSANGSVSSILPLTMPTTTTSAVSYIKSESSLQLTNSAGIGTYAVIASQRLHKYRPGQGGLGRFTCVYDTPVSGTQQIAGIGNQVSGFFFGYNPASNPPEFGIMHRQSGLATVKKIEITVASASETLTIVIDGLTVEIVLTSNATTTFIVAQEIVDNKLLFSAGQWTIDAYDNYVYFLSKTATGPRTNNTYSFSSGGSTVGTWSTETEGVSVSNNWIPQSDWNANTMNGYMSNSMYLVPQRGNVYQIQYQWLGYGAIVFSIEDIVTGHFVPVHIIDYANKNTIPSMGQPMMRLLWGVNSATSATSLTMKLTSGALFNEGELSITDNVFSNTQIRTTTTSDEEHLVTYKNNLLFYGKGNNATFTPTYLSFINDGNKGGVIRIYANSDITNPQYTSIDSLKSSTSCDIVSTIANGTLIFAFAISGSSNERISDSTLKNLLLHPQQTFSITVQRSTTTNMEISAVVVWQEDQ
jgi:hypothetical protein